MFSPDSDVLLSSSGSFVRRAAAPLERAASELELRRSAEPPRRRADTASLHDAPLMDDTDTDNGTDDNGTDNDTGMYTMFINFLVLIRGSNEYDFL